MRGYIWSKSKSSGCSVESIALFNKSSELSSYSLRKGEVLRKREGTYSLPNPPSHSCRSAELNNRTFPVSTQQQVPPGELGSTASSKVFPVPWPEICSGESSIGNEDNDSFASCLYSTNLGDADRRVRENSKIEESGSLSSVRASSTIFWAQHFAVKHSEPFSSSFQWSIKSQNRSFHSFESNSLTNVVNKRLIRCRLEHNK